MEDRRSRQYGQRSKVAYYITSWKNETLIPQHHDGLTHVNLWSVSLHYFSSFHAYKRQKVFWGVFPGVKFIPSDKPTRYASSNTSGGNKTTPKAPHLWSNCNVNCEFLFNMWLIFSSTLMRKLRKFAGASSFNHNWNDIFLSHKQNETSSDQSR